LLVMAELTKSEYAARLGIRPSMVSNYIRRQQLTAPALTAGGRVNVELADKQLRVTVDPVRQASRPGRAARATADVITTAPAGPIDFQASAVLLRARAMVAQIGAERLRREFQAERGRYMLTTTAEAEMRQVVEEIVSVIDQAIPDLIDALGEDRRHLPIVRKWWHAVRAKEAARHAAAAAAAPEFVTDDAAVI
jgi:hypothetical protein